MERQSVLHLTAAAGDLARLYPWLEQAATDHGVAAGVRYGMHVALEEAVANVAMHAFAPGEAGEITVQLLTTPEGPVLAVEDGGRAFDPLQAPAAPRPESLAAAEPGGLGLGLIRHYCRAIDYVRSEGRNRLTMRFAAA